MRPFLLFLLISLFSASGYAQETQYLSALPDIPLMQGMRKIEDSGIVFDKAEGRIIEESVLAPGLSEKAIKNFYSSTLPALGWTGKGAQRFLRNGEQLIVNLEKVQDSGVVRFSVSPNEP